LRKFFCDFGKATQADSKIIRELLEDNGLPSDDYEDHIESFIVVKEGGKVIGIGGLEKCGAATGLVRSIVVVPGHRGKGVANEIYMLIEDKAHNLGIKTLYLLTESATEYFKKLGFEIVERIEVPESVKKTKQFRDLCPVSAAVMFRDISKRSW